MPPKKDKKGGKKSSKKKAEAVEPEHDPSWDRVRAPSTHPPTQICIAAHAARTRPGRRAFAARSSSAVTRTAVKNQHGQEEAPRATKGLAPTARAAAVPSAGRARRRVAAGGDGAARSAAPSSTARPAPALACAHAPHPTLLTSMMEGGRAGEEGSRPAPRQRNGRGGTRTSYHIISYHIISRPLPRRGHVRSASELAAGVASLARRLQRVADLGGAEGAHSVLRHSDPHPQLAHGWVMPSRRGRRGRTRKSIRRGTATPCRRSSKCRR